MFACVLYTIVNIRPSVQFCFVNMFCSVLSVSSLMILTFVLFCPSRPVSSVRLSVCYVHPFPSRPPVCLLCPSRPVSRPSVCLLCYVRLSSRMEVNFSSVVMFNNKEGFVNFRLSCDIIWFRLRHVAIRPGNWNPWTSRLFVYHISPVRPLSEQITKWT